MSDMLARYTVDDDGAAGFELYPANRSLPDAEKNGGVDSMVQVCARGDSFSSGFSNGHTMRNSETTRSLRYGGQSVEKNLGEIRITTTLRNGRGAVARHVLTHREGARALVVKTVFRNESDKCITLEMLSSFSIGNLTPYLAGAGAGSMVAYTIRSNWSAEGRLVSSPVEELGLEQSWARFGVRSMRFGQIGSMPVRKYFPFSAVEDTKNHVVWAAQIACPSSWQMEFYRQDDALNMSGGLADYDFGHWAKTLRPGEEFETPEAILTVCAGDIDEACQRLVTAHEKSAALKSSLPVLFNEYCTTWGKPSHESISNILEHLPTKDIRYFVIDAGWYTGKNDNWDSIGDWNVSADRFPQGLEATVALIRKAGLIPGIWFELENCASGSQIFGQEEHLLKRGGTVLQSGSRRFLDMRDAYVERHLTEKVIGMLKHYGFKYLKIDYNESIGVGCDGAESLGEGLRQNMLATQEFFRKIRREIPDIVIEICASGGHRLEPSMLALCDMESFSDAHECREIPLIAANLHRVVQPGKLQIWAVLRKDDSLNRIAYFIANTFYGVMCLSGDVYDLDARQWELVERGVAFYHSVSPLISNGTSRFFGTDILCYRAPEGWRATVRYSENQKEALVIVHIFGGKQPVRIEIPLAAEYEIAGVYGVRDAVTLSGATLTVLPESEFEAFAVHLVSGQSANG